MTTVVRSNARSWQRWHFISTPANATRLQQLSASLPLLVMLLSLLTLSFIATPGAAQTPQSPSPSPATDVETLSPGANLQIYLLTAGQGDEFWNLFGHNALLVQDTAAGIEQVFNFGLFDLSEPDFMTRVATGNMIYAVGAASLELTLARYERENRTVHAQELDLVPAQRLALAQLLWTAVLPENSRYRYDYFLNNCATKVRDVLDQVLDGQLRAATEGVPAESSWREEVRRLTAGHLWGYLGLELMLGRRSNESMNGWEELWMPRSLRNAVGELVIRRADGSSTPLVRSEEIWLEGVREPELTEAPPLNILFPLTGLILAGVLSLSGSSASAGRWTGKLGLAVVGTAWGTLCFALSVALIGVHWTDHSFAYWNANVFIFSPVGLALAALVPGAAFRGNTKRPLRRLTALAAILTIIGMAVALIPGWPGISWEYMTFALPVHLALWWVISRMLKHADELIYHT